MSQVIHVSTPIHSDYSHQDRPSYPSEPEPVPCSLVEGAVLELLGTALFVYISLAGVSQSVLAALDSHSSVNQLQVALCFMLGLSSGIVVALRSGAHLNSSVSFTLWLAGQMSFKKMLLYIAAQMVGAFLAALLVMGVYYSHITKLPQSNALLGSFGTLKDPNNSLVSSMLDQFIGSALLMMGILRSPDSGYKPLVIGMVLGGLGLFQGSNGFAFNPARDLAPRLASMIMFGTDPFVEESYWFWVPMVIPFIGMPVGYLLGHRRA